MRTTLSPLLRAFVWICVLCLSVAGCDTPTEVKTTPVGSPDTDVAATDNAAAKVPVETSMQKWAKSCALCHVAGVGGAPRVGVAQEWSQRLTQGKSVLMSHTIEGFNNMPPLGYCMSCEESDFSSMIDYMAGENP